VIVVAGLVLAVISVPLAGGHLTRAADLRFKAPWAIGLALLIQIVIISLVPGGGPLRPALHVGTYILAGVFLVLNRKIGGLWILMLGAVINAFVIGVNGGVMPANATALRTAGIHPSATEFANSAARPGAHLSFLGDVFALPAPLPLHNVFSVGDVLIVLGAGAILHIASDSRLARRFSRSPDVSGTPVQP
jgi:Family of unknown function (DUF5317)